MSLNPTAPRCDHRRVAGSALFIVDVQNDFCPGGALAVPDADRVIPVLNRMIDRFSSTGRPVYASRDWHPADTRHFKTLGGPWPVHCVAGSAGAKFHPGLRLPDDAIVISKGQDRSDDGYSAFEGVAAGGVRLGEHLEEHGISELYIGGLATDYCVRATALDAASAGLRVAVVTDAIAGITAEDSRRALDELRKAGVSLVTSSQVDQQSTDA